MSTILLHFLITACTWSILAMALNLAVGSGGLFNLGHVAFAAVGAYTAVLLEMKLNLPWLLAMPAGALLAGLFGVGIGLLTLRLKGDYFAIATLGFGVVLQSVLNNWQSLTRGPVGIPGIPAPLIFGLRIRGLPLHFLLTAVLLLLTLYVMRRINAAPFGRALRAIREDEHAAMALGKPVLAIKVQAAGLSALFAGVAGILHAHYIRFIDPQQFGLRDTVFVLVAVILGGLGNPWGAVLGAALLVGMQQGIPYLGLPAGMAGGIQQLIYSLALVLLMLFRPKGLLPEGRVRLAAAPAPAAGPAGGRDQDG